MNRKMRTHQALLQARNLIEYENSGALPHITEALQKIEHEILNEVGTVIREAVREDAFYDILEAAGHDDMGPFDGACLLVGIALHDCLKQRSLDARLQYTYGYNKTDPMATRIGGHVFVAVGGLLLDGDGVQTQEQAIQHWQDTELFITQEFVSILADDREAFLLNLPEDHIASACNHEVFYDRQVAFALSHYFAEKINAAP